MKATALLNRYAKGDRDFRRTNLRGQNFKGQDLSGADFSEADIRGTNFTNANLRSANFTGAKAGLTPCWIASLIVISGLVALTTGWASGVANIIASSAVSATFIQRYTLIPTIGIFAVIASFFVTTVRYGVTIALATLAWLLGLVWTLTWFGARDNASDWTLALVLALGWAWLWAWSGALIKVVTHEYWEWIWLCVLALVWTVAGVIASAWSTTGTWVFAGVASFVLAWLGAFIGKQALRGDPKFTLIKLVMITFGSICGTSFWQADLCDSDFAQATLNNADLRSSNMERIHWENTQYLDRARVGDSILANPSVRELLVTRNGYKKLYIDVNLRAANLNGVNLEEANLTLANLTCATLRHANLKAANLNEALVLHTDFTEANLTGACLEAWNIDSQTILEQVNCQYVYLLRNQQERRPSSGDFALGEFTKLFQEVLSTVDLIFRNGVDWKAFVTAFKQVQVQNEETPLEIQSIENKGDGVVVVRVNVPPETNKQKIHSEFNQQYDLSLKALEAKYQSELNAKEGEIAIYREQNVNMWGVINSLANRPINVQTIAKAMNESSDRSQNFNVSGDFNINATNAVVSLGDISGTVTNAINQLPTSPDPTQPGIKELLAELQAEIEASPDLSEDDKKDALEQVNVLATLGQNPNPSETEGLGRKAIKLLKGTVASLPETTKIVEASTKLLPWIARILGLPV